VERHRRSSDQIKDPVFTAADQMVMAFTAIGAELTQLRIAK
jgi:hypothetical protein